MSDPRDDLRATEHSIRRDAEQVRDVEDEKAALDPDDPRVGHLTERVEELTGRLRDKAAAERDIRDELKRSG